MVRSQSLKVSGPNGLGLSGIWRSEIKAATAAVKQ
jgi:hypothetical protein